MKSPVKRLLRELRGMKPGAMAAAWLLAAIAWSANGTEAGPGNGVIPADDSAGEVVSLTIEGIAPATGDDDPRVLYILPWQPPTLPRRPRADLNARAPDLLEPLDPVVLERHRRFRQTLNPEMGSSLSLY